MIDMRDSAARESVEEVEDAALLRLEQEASARGSMPGIGTNDSKRNRTSAPSVNHSRFLSSVALEKVESEMIGGQLFGCGCHR
jgi:hypothetical protein